MQVFQNKPSGKSIEVKVADNRPNTLQLKDNRSQSVLQGLAGGHWALLKQAETRKQTLG